MYRIYCFKFLLCILLSGSMPVVFSQAQDVVIRITQDESSNLADFQTFILLKRKPFKFQVVLDHVEGVYVFASIRDSVYRFTETSKIQDFRYLKLLELRNEDVFNTNRELSISESGWSYWFYKPEPALHPFSRKVVMLDSNRIVCTKYIKQLWDVAEGKVIKLKDLNTPLYLFFIAVSEYDDDGRPLKELIRRKIKIDWTAEDD